MLTDKAVAENPADATTTGTTTAKASSRRRSEAGTFEKYAVLGLFALIVVLFSILVPETFPTSQNARTVIDQQAVRLLVALALLLPLIVGEFDLSVGYTVGLSGIIAAKYGPEHGGVVAIALVLIAGALIGAINGYLVVRRGINSLIVTLGIGFVVSGISIGLSGAATLSQDIPELILTIPDIEFLTLGLNVWLTIAITLVIYLVVARSPLGRRMYAVGSNETVARLAGIRTQGIRMGAFVAAGLIAAVAGLLQLGIAGAALPTFGPNLLLPAFAGAFLGSTCIDPGRFNVMGTVTAILLLATGFSGLSLIGANFWVEPVFSGLVLIGAVLLAQVRRSRRTKS